MPEYNAVYTDGGGPVTGDGLNTFAQYASTVADLRNFIGQDNMVIVLLGGGSPNDGVGGLFYWTLGAGTDDGIDTIVPNGSTGGFWQRLFPPIPAVFHTGANLPVAIGQDLTSPSRSMISLVGGGNGLTEAACVGMFGGATGENILFLTAPTQGQLGIAGSGIVFWESGGFKPQDASTHLGESGFRWIDVWAQNGTIQTSDLRAKRDVCDGELGLDFIQQLKPISWRWHHDGPDDRQHHGFAAQHVKEALGDREFGGLHHDKDSGQPVGLNYSELIAPLVKAVQELSAKVAALEAAAGR